MTLLTAKANCLSVQEQKPLLLGQALSFRDLPACCCSWHPGSLGCSPLATGATLTNHFFIVGNLVIICTYHQERANFPDNFIWPVNSYLSFLPLSSFALISPPQPFPFSLPPPPPTCCSEMQDFEDLGRNVTRFSLAE